MSEFLLILICLFNLMLEDVYKRQSSDNTNKVLPFSENKTALWYYGCFEDLLQSLKKDTLFVYVFDAEIVETTPWDTVLANNLILKRYDLSLEDLQNMNWTIIYP